MADYEITGDVHGAAILHIFAIRAAPAPADVKGFADVNGASIVVCENAGYVVAFCDIDPTAGLRPVCVLYLDIIDRPTGPCARRAKRYRSGEEKTICPPPPPELCQLCFS